MTKSNNNDRKNIAKLIPGGPKDSPLNPAFVSPDAFSVCAQRLVDFEAAYQRSQFGCDHTTVATLASLKGANALKLKAHPKADEAGASVRAIYKEQKEGA